MSFLIKEGVEASRVLPSLVGFSWEFCGECCGGNFYKGNFLKKAPPVPPPKLLGEKIKRITKKINSCYPFAFDKESFGMV